MSTEASNAICRAFKTQLAFTVGMKAAQAAKAKRIHTKSQGQVHCANSRHRDIIIVTKSKVLLSPLWLASLPRLAAGVLPFRCPCPLVDEVHEVGLSCRPLTSVPWLLSRRQLRSCCACCKIMSEPSFASCCFIKSHLTLRPPPILTFVAARPRPFHFPICLHDYPFPILLPPFPLPAELIPGGPRGVSSYGSTLSPSSSSDSTRSGSV
jgi:hypothetical protein